MFRKIPLMPFTGDFACCSSTVTESSSNIEWSPLVKTMAVEALHAGDIAAICVYFVIIIAVGIWVSLCECLL